MKKSATDIPTQYEHVARDESPNTKVVSAKEQELNRQVTSLLIQSEAQRRVIDKLVRDVKRLKDQVSELAGRTRG